MSKQEKWKYPKIEDLTGIERAYERINNTLPDDDTPSIALEWHLELWYDYRDDSIWTGDLLTQNNWQEYHDDRIIRIGNYWTDLGDMSLEDFRKEVREKICDILYDWNRAEEEGWR